MKIQKNESHDTEFKQNWRDEYLKWICAFANTHGGSLYIGVKDDGEICGVENSHKLSEDIPNKILQATGLICDVNLLNKNGKKYLRIDVEKYPFPVSYHGKYYKRSGSTTQEVTGYELDKMILAVQGRTWDSVPVPHVSADDLDKDSIKIFRKRALDHNRLDKEALDVPDEVLLRNLRLFENDYLTKAAVMCFHPDPEKWVTCAYIKIGFFADNDADILYQDEIHGSLIIQVEKAMDLIYTKYMKALISYNGIYRKETFFFPKEAFRELLLNAVIHRDYMRPTPIQIRVYAHKIRIWNIGKMPVEVPVEKLFEPHSSEPRNPNIANVFFKAGYVESWGRGYKNISDICKFRKATLPVPEENSGGLAVECPPSKEYLAAEKKQGKMVTEDDAVNGIAHDLNGAVNDVNGAVNDVNGAVNDVNGTVNDVNGTVNDVNGTVNDVNGTVNDVNGTVNDVNGTVNDVNGAVNDVNGAVNDLELSKTEQEVLDAIVAFPSYSYEQLAEVCNLSRRTIARIIKSFQNNKLIQRIGSDKAGRWEIIDEGRVGDKNQ